MITFYRKRKLEYPTDYRVKSTTIQGNEKQEEEGRRSKQIDHIGRGYQDCFLKFSIGICKLRIDKAFCSAKKCLNMICATRSFASHTVLLFW